MTIFDHHPEPKTPKMLEVMESLDTLGFVEGPKQATLLVNGAVVALGSLGLSSVFEDLSFNREDSQPGGKIIFGEANGSTSRCTVTSVLQEGECKSTVSLSSDSDSHTVQSLLAVVLTDSATGLARKLTVTIGCATDGTEMDSFTDVVFDPSSGEVTVSTVDSLGAKATLPNQLAGLEDVEITTIAETLHVIALGIL